MSVSSDINRHAPYKQSALLAACFKFKTDLYKASLTNTSLLERRRARRRIRLSARTWQRRKQIGCTVISDSESTGVFGHLDLEWSVVRILLLVERFLHQLVDPIDSRWVISTVSPIRHGVFVTDSIELSAKLYKKIWGRATITDKPLSHHNEGKVSITANSYISVHLYTYWRTKEWQENFRIQAF